MTRIHDLRPQSDAGFRRLPRIVRQSNGVGFRYHHHPQRSREQSATGEEIETLAFACLFDALVR
ncbi:hypothetical protein C2S53_012725 [Perilla frutescens var. hirtella]|uniref:Uncharacterized protein n=1 Tax=Perilla frutescens var. hirtella TaxID=608512 RepID=A0AAD4NWX1_PERFH|nr:hypothetical protein C2S53_012725 [Perilla frutescens var. hirtella]